MSIVNWQGSAIFGPGSEWFWSMAQFIVVVVTLFGIYRQLQAQGGANALARIETLHRRYQSREMLVAKVKVLMQLRFGAPPSEMNALMDPIANFFDTLHDLHDAGFITLNEIDDRFGGGVQIWWRLLHPAIEGSRVIENEPGLLEGFQKLDARCGERAFKRGFPRTHFLEAPLGELLDEMIKRTTEGLQLQIDVDSDSIPQPPAEPVPADSQ